MAPVSIAAAAILASSLPSIAAMKWERRVLLVCAPNVADPALIRQRRFMADWQSGANERDVTVVEIIGEKVTGAGDPATTLRRRYALPTHGFAVILIGKDGGIKLRQPGPIPVSTLEKTIDAMPMRRGGGR